MSLHRRLLYLAPLVVPGFSTLLPADTVYLKNGAWIDGIVRSRNEKAVEIEIGRIGKVEIAAEDIHEIEKNNRTGADSKDEPERQKQEVSVVTKDGKRVVVAEKPKKPDGGEGDEPGNEPGNEASERGDPSSKADSGGSKGSDARSKGPPGKRSGDGAKKEEKPIDPELKARIETLVEELQRQKPQFRVRAERHLKAIGQPSIPFLLPLAKSDGELTRTAAFRLFYDFGDDTVIEACVGALLDSNEYVRDFANKTLERVTHESFGYQPSATPRRREAAAEKWRKWWEKEKEELEKETRLKE